MNFKSSKKGMMAYGGAYGGVYGGLSVGSTPTHGCSPMMPEAVSPAHAPAACTPQVVSPVSHTPQAVSPNYYHQMYDYHMKCAKYYKDMYNYHYKMACYYKKMMKNKHCGC